MWLSFLSGAIIVAFPPTLKLQDDLVRQWVQTKKGNVKESSEQ